jgi:hypothetical protein
MGQRYFLILSLILATGAQAESKPATPAAANKNKVQVKKPPIHGGTQKNASQPVEAFEESSANEALQKRAYHFTSNHNASTDNPGCSALMAILFKGANGLQKGKAADKQIREVNGVVCKVSPRDPAKGLQQYSCTIRDPNASVARIEGENALSLYQALAQLGNKNPLFSPTEFDQPGDFNEATNQEEPAQEIAFVYAEKIKVQRTADNKTTCSVTRGLEAIGSP